MGEVLAFVLLRVKKVRILLCLQEVLESLEDLSLVISVLQLLLCNTLSLNQLSIFRAKSGLVFLKELQEIELGFGGRPVVRVFTFVVKVETIEVDLVLLQMQTLVHNVNHVAALGMMVE